MTWAFHMWLFSSSDQQNGGPTPLCAPGQRPGLVRMQQSPNGHASFPGNIPQVLIIRATLSGKTRPCNLDRL